MLVSVSKDVIETAVVVYQINYTQTATVPQVFFDPFWPGWKSFVLFVRKTLSLHRKWIQKYIHLLLNTTKRNKSGNVNLKAKCSVPQLEDAAGQSEEMTADEEPARKTAASVLISDLLTHVMGLHWLTYSSEVLVFRTSGHCRLLRVLGVMLLPKIPT